jgi:hypothetical protein
MVRDARRCRAPHHEGLRPHPEEAPTGPREARPDDKLRAVSKDEATELALAPLTRTSRCFSGAAAAVFFSIAHVTRVRTLFPGRSGAAHASDKRILTAALESNDIKRSCSSNQLNFIKRPETRSNETSVFQPGYLTVFCRILARQAEP